MSNYNQLKNYVVADEEKQKLIDELLLTKKSRGKIFYCKGVELNQTEFDDDADMEIFREKISERCEEVRLESPFAQFSRACPKCGRKFSRRDTFCPDCLVSLKPIDDKPDIKNIKNNPKISCKGINTYKSFDELMNDENFALINNFDFTMKDFGHIIRDIKLQGFKNMDKMIKDNEIDLDELDVLDKVLIFAKSFVSVEYKSYGATLGYYEYNKIHIDDRQRKSLQITTLIHELSHFLLKEILTHIICDILNATKNKYVESLVTYILSNSVFNNLIDEYAAHTVEGRFTVFGYQDYSSFVAIQDNLEAEHIEIAKTIGNTFAVHIKDMLESFIDWDLREEIKSQLLSDTIEDPDYRQLVFESCNMLSDEGFLKAIWLILTEGFQDVDLELLMSYKKEF